LSSAHARRDELVQIKKEFDEEYDMDDLNDEPDPGMLQLYEDYTPR
jgi:hypothetical protein